MGVAEDKVVGVAEDKAEGVAGDKAEDMDEAEDGGEAWDMDVRNLGILNIF